MLFYDYTDLNMISPIRMISLILTANKVRGLFGGFQLFALRFRLSPAQIKRF